MFQLTPECPLGSQVPLSCVPPIKSFESKGLTDRLWNWSVERPLFRPVSSVGTRDSSCWQIARFAALRLREAH